MLHLHKLSCFTCSNFISISFAIFVFALQLLFFSLSLRSCGCWEGSRQFDTWRRAIRQDNDEPRGDAREEPAAANGRYLCDALMHVNCLLLSVKRPNCQICWAPSNRILTSHLQPSNKKSLRLNWSLESKDSRGTRWSMPRRKKRILYQHWNKLIRRKRLKFRLQTSYHIYHLHNYRVSLMRKYLTP